jgi:hypothetical protein
MGEECTVRVRERVTVRGRRGTLILSTPRMLTEEEFGDMVAHLRRAVTREVPVLVLDGGLKVEGVIPAAPRSRRQRGHRPRWAR